jgi:hypothetical protein
MAAGRGSHPPSACQTGPLNALEQWQNHRRTASNHTESTSKQHDAAGSCTALAR